MITTRGGATARLLLATLCAGIAPTMALAASDEDCRTFHAECEEAKAAGFRDVGICNVERLECQRGGAESSEEGAGKTPRSPETLPERRPDPERSIGP